MYWENDMDRASAEAVMNKFCAAARKRYNSDAYALGFCQSVLLNLLEELKPNVCMQQLMYFEKQTVELEKETVVDALKKST
jgi:hypothetical protein